MNLTHHNSSTALCPRCRTAVSENATECPDCGEMFPAIRDRQGSYIRAFARMILIAVALVASFGVIGAFYESRIVTGLAVLAIAAFLWALVVRLYRYPGNFP